MAKTSGIWVCTIVIDGSGMWEFFRDSNKSKSTANEQSDGKQIHVYRNYKPAWNSESSQFERQYGYVYYEYLILAYDGAE